MKMRNLLYASVIACVLASCSKEDDVIGVNPTPNKGNASLVIGISSSVQTRAIAETSTEDQINSLVVAVFNTDGSLVAVKDTTASNGAIRRTPTVNSLISGNTYKVLAIANKRAADFKGKSTIGEFQTVTQNLVDGSDVVEVATGAGLTMSSEVITTGSLIAGPNLYAASSIGGYNKVGSVDITLYRNVAKVVVNTISLKMKDPVAYKNATFTLDSVYLKNAPKQTLLIGAGADAKNSTYYTSTGFYSGSKGDADPLAYYAQSYTSNNVITDMLQSQGSVFAAADSFYVYANQNTNNKTWLVVKGTVKYATANGAEKTLPNRCYTIIVNETGTFSVGSDSSKGTGKIDRNMRYQIDLTLSGTGSNTPDPDPVAATLDCFVKVAPYGIIEQTAEFE